MILDDDTKNMPTTFCHLLTYSLFCAILVLRRKVCWLHTFTFQTTVDITDR